MEKEGFLERLRKKKNLRLSKPVHQKPEQEKQEEVFEQVNQESETERTELTE